MPRLFSYWFNKAGQQERYYFKTAEVKGEEPGTTWQSDEAEGLLKTKLDIDVHSAFHNRVNGTLRLIDDWYTLFGVEPGDKLYVKPEDRVKIW